MTKKNLDKLKENIILQTDLLDLKADYDANATGVILEYELIAEELSGDTLFAEVSAMTKKNLDKLKENIILQTDLLDLKADYDANATGVILEYELIAEELSGDTLFAEVSAMTKKNLDKLKENIILQTDLLDLKADYDANATGVILESRIDKGKGPVSTVLITNGSLKKGNFFVSGNTWGKIRAMINDEGQKIDLAEPSTPVEILGMNGSAFSSVSTTMKSSPAKADPFIPKISTGVEGSAKSIF
jgi:translation initiation factor IF-2